MRARTLVAFALSFVPVVVVAASPCACTKSTPPKASGTGEGATSSSVSSSASASPSPSAEPAALGSSPPASGASSSAAAACTKDDDCAIHASYCGTCACLALLASESPPACPTKPVQCFVNPCLNKAARCVAGACTAVTK